MNRYVFAILNIWWIIILKIYKDQIFLNFVT